MVLTCDEDEDVNRRPLSDIKILWYPNVSEMSFNLLIHQVLVVALV